MAFFAEMKKKAAKMKEKTEKNYPQVVTTKDKSELFDEFLTERAKNTHCPDIHFPIKQFEFQDYNQLLNIHDIDTDEDKNADSEEINDSNKGEIRKIHIVHISDTHMSHNKNIIPFKKDMMNILIHSGDFSQRAKLTNNGEIPQQIYDFNKWFINQPHQKKIIIAGNHEILLNHFSKPEIKEKIFECEVNKNVTYLQDDGINLFGIKMYGTPWTSSRKMGFSASHKKLKEKWQLIPDHNNIDILITHLPPSGIMDTAYSNKYNFNEICNICNYLHPKYRHWGNVDLLKEVTDRIKPKVHLFGHVHQCAGCQIYKNVVFINSAMDLWRIPHQFDVVFDL